jgi:hypothetical protein
MLTKIWQTDEVGNLNNIVEIRHPPTTPGAEPLHTDYV